MGLLRTQAQGSSLLIRVSLKSAQRAHDALESLHAKVQVVIKYWQTLFEFLKLEETFYNIVILNAARQFLHFQLSIKWTEFLLLFMFRWDEIFRVYNYYYYYYRISIDCVSHFCIFIITTTCGALYEPRCRGLMRKFNSLGPIWHPWKVVFSDIGRRAEWWTLCVHTRKWKKTSFAGRREWISVI